MQENILYFSKDRPLSKYTSRFPHWIQDGCMYFITFRLGDSIPEDLLELLKIFKRNEAQQKEQPISELKSFKTLAEIHSEKYLDKGFGNCLLKNQCNRKIMLFVLNEYQIIDRFLSFVIMPNHVHAIVKPLKDEGSGKLIQLWKGRSAFLINRSASNSGKVWMKDYHNRIIRSPKHLIKCHEYIINNP